MGLFSTLRTSSNSSQAIAAALKVTSDNIAGANDKNYDRQDAILTSNPWTGGVTLKRVVREVAPLLEQIERLDTSSTHHAKEINKVYQKIASILGLDDAETPTLVKVVEDFSRAWQEYHQDPASTANKQELIRMGQKIGDTLRSLSTDLSAYKFQLQQDTRDEVERLNQLLQNVQEYNEDIAHARANGLNSSTFESERDGVLIEISKIIQIHVFDRDNGQVSLWTTTGADLVDKGVVSRFEFDNNGDLIKITYPERSPFFSDEGNLRLPEGSLLAKLNLTFDSFTTAQPGYLDSDGVGVFSKIENQLDDFARLWTDNIANSFTETYNNLPASDPPRAGEVIDEFFIAPIAGVPTDRFNLNVNPDLLDDPNRLKRANLVNMVENFRRSNKDFNSLNLSGGALTLQQRDVLTITTILTNHWGQSINLNKDNYELQEKSLTGLNEKIKSITGVDINEELAELTVLQTAFAANARVMNTVTEMLDALLAIKT